MAFGSSYGGYIASLLSKYAPFTFSLIIDNSGFCLTSLQEVLGEAIQGQSGSIARYINVQRYEVPIVADTIWSLDETSEYYFSDAHKQIRNLLVEGHRTSSPTMYCCYHSTEDELVPIKQKDQLYEMLARYNTAYYQRIEEKDIDGAVFKNMRHGMDASLKSIFDISFEKYNEMRQDKDDAIDFDKNVTYGFPCSNKIYSFSYTDSGLDVQIEKLYV